MEKLCTEPPLCEVLSRVQSARSRKAHAPLSSPLGDLEEPQPAGAVRLRPVHLPPLIASLQPGLPPFRGTTAGLLAFRQPLPWLSRLVRQLGLPGLREAPTLGTHIPPGRGRSFSVSDTCLL